MTSVTIVPADWYHRTKIGYAGPMSDVTGAIIVVVIAAIGCTAAWTIGWAIQRAGRRLPGLARPFRTLVATITALSALHLYAPPDGWHVIIHLITLLVIAAGAWLLCSMLFVIEDSARPRLRTDISDNRHVAAHTQISGSGPVLSGITTAIATNAALCFVTAALIALFLHTPTREELPA
jgi:hypothetical protein